MNIVKNIRTIICFAVFIYGVCVGYRPTIYSTGQKVFFLFFFKGLLSSPRLICVVVILIKHTLIL